MNNPRFTTNPMIRFRILISILGAVVALTGTDREPGRKFGVRLLHVDSIRSWLMSELEAQEARLISDE